ncbi:ABC transporter substrate-binding protein, partial [Sporanaerobacter acetigenes]|uniref:ABC transporter substrate-binding protein n=1 Tax=Sporanaerobacter acetigenes TaxID=165813 RepID=UPI00331B46F6
MKKGFKFLIFIMIAAMLLSGCSNEKNVATNQKEETVAKGENKEPLEINLQGGDWGYPSPYTHYSRGPGIFKMRLIFDSLLERGEEGLIPWLAESWDISDDGKLYTFKIREGVKWQDGEPMTAEDVKFSFDYYSKYPPISDDLGISENNYIEKIEVVDENTINIQVNEPNATLLERFGTARIIPKHIWSDVDDPTKFTDSKAVIGCGPYILTDYN